MDCSCWLVHHGRVLESVDPSNQIDPTIIFRAKYYICKKPGHKKLVICYEVDQNSGVAKIFQWKFYPLCNGACYHPVQHALRVTGGHERRPSKSLRENSFFDWTKQCSHPKVWTWRIIEFSDSFLKGDSYYASEKGWPKTCPYSKRKYIIMVHFLTAI